MNKDPAIERMIAVNELTKILCGKPCDICSFYGQRPKCMPVYTAEKIVDAGWRKASEVAEEIFAEIEKIRLKEIHKCETLYERENEVLQRKYWEGGYNSLRQLSYWIAELKKKYTEGEKENENL